MNSVRHYFPLHLLFLAAMSNSLAQENDQRPTAVPSESTEEMLQRFVDECVAITPGKGDFPKTAVIGSTTPEKYELARSESALTQSFRISRYEMTQELYQAITKQNPSRWKGPRNSVEGVTWQDAVKFCSALTRVLQARNLIADDQIVRLPTAIEWEYCCRAGSTTDYCFGADAPVDGDAAATLDAHAWHTGNAAGNDPAVGVLKPNSWGLHDVHGYLWEFVSDSVLEKSTGERVIRGGSWRDRSALLSSSTYLTIPDHVSSDAIGFRCVISQKPDTKNGPNR